MAVLSSSANHARTGHHIQTASDLGRAVTPTRSHQKAAAPNRAAEYHVATETSESRFAALHSGNAVRCKMPITTNTLIVMPEKTATTALGILEANTTKRLDFVDSTAEDSESITDTTARADSESAPVS